MPAAAIAIPLISTAFSIGSSIVQTKKAGDAAKQAQEHINNYQKQDLINPALGLQVSTLGADRQREDISRSIAQLANTAAFGGSRSILGIAPNLLSQQVQQQQQIAGTLDEAEARRQAAVAQGQAQVMGMTEQRENNDLLGMGNQLNVANQERAMGVNNLIQSGLAGASLGLEMNGEGMFDNLFTKKYKPIPTGKPAGIIMPTKVFNPESLPSIPNLPINFGVQVNPFNLPYLMSSL